MKRKKQKRKNSRVSPTGNKWTELESIFSDKLSSRRSLSKLKSLEHFSLEFSRLECRVIKETSCASLKEMKMCRTISSPMENKNHDIAEINENPGRYY